MDAFELLGSMDPDGVTVVDDKVICCVLDYFEKYQCVVIESDRLIIAGDLEWSEAWDLINGYPNDYLVIDVRSNKVARCVNGRCMDPEEFCRDVRFPTVCLWSHSLFSTALDALHVLNDLEDAGWLVPDHVVVYLKSLVS